MQRLCSGSFSVNDCAPWVLGGKALQQTSIADAVEYLGIKFNPWGGVVRPDLAVLLNKWCHNVVKSPLKPLQRVVLLNQYAIPRFFYQADLCKVGNGVLQCLDGMIRRSVKKCTFRLQPVMGYCIQGTGDLQALLTNPICPSEKDFPSFSLLGCVGSVLDEEPSRKIQICWGVAKSWWASG